MGQALPAVARLADRPVISEVGTRWQRRTQKLPPGLVGIFKKTCMTSVQNLDPQAILQEMLPRSNNSCSYRLLGWDHAQIAVLLCGTVTQTLAPPFYTEFLPSLSHDSMHRGLEDICCWAILG